MVLAIDGPAGVGKSTIARLIAEKADWLYINSGNFYRAITKSCLDAGVDMNDRNAMIKNAYEAKLEFIGKKLYLNGEYIEEQLHNDVIDGWVSPVSAVPEIRQKVNGLLREAAGNLNIIVEGRDMTTVVFPDADFKIYFDASIETRARRRFDQGTSNMSYEALVESIRKRDEMDKNKPVGSLKIAGDAVYLDTSYLTIDQVCEKVLHTIQYEHK